MHLTALGFAETTELFTVLRIGNITHHIRISMCLCVCNIYICNMYHTCRFHLITNSGFVLSGTFAILPLRCYTFISSHPNYTCSLPLPWDMHSPLSQPTFASYSMPSLIN